MSFHLKLVEISLLFPHEKINKKRLPKLLAKVKKDQFVTPIVADKKTFVILDGHHRFEIMKTLKFKTVPVYLVNYGNGNIKVVPRRKKYSVTKKEIIKRGLDGNLYPHKTTRHSIKGLGKWKIPLEILE